MRKHKISFVIIVVWLVSISCSLSGGLTDPTATVAATVITETSTLKATLSSTPLPSATQTKTSLPPSLTPTLCSPNVVTTVNSNVRSGPGLVYDTVGSIPLGGSAEVVGKSADGAWWYINFAGGSGGHAWVAGSVVTANCIPATLVVIAAPPTPTNTVTPKPPTLTRTPTSTRTLPPLTRILELKTPYMTGADVKMLQNRLVELGYNIGTVDGIFGTKTDTAVRAFQTSQHLTSDGKVGKLTWAALFQ